MKSKKIPTGISKDAQGRYYGRYYAYDLKRDKKIQKRTKFFKLLRDAVQNLNQLKAEAPKTRNEALAQFRNRQSTTFMTLDNAFNEFIVHYSHEVKPSTLHIIKSRYATHISPIFGNRDVHQILVKDLQNFKVLLINKEYKANYIKNIINTFGLIYSYLSDMYAIEYNPLLNLNLKLKNDSKKDNFITKVEYDAFIKNVHDIHHKLIFELLYYTGMRVGELSALQWSDFKDDVIIISKTVTTDEKGKLSLGTTKTNMMRKIRIPQHLKTLWTSYYNSIKDTEEFNNQFFVVSGIKIARPTTVNILYQKYRIYPHLTIHGFRHSHASYLISQNIPVADIAKRLGHANITTTLNTYAHFFKNDEQNIVDVL